MRISKIWCVAAVAVVGVVALAGCGDSPAAPAPVATTLRIEPGEVSLAMGASQQLSVIRFDETGAPMAPPTAGAEVIWSSGDSTIVTIDESGMVLGRRPGSTTIVARTGALEASVAAAVVPVELVLESERSVSTVIGFAGGILVAEGAGGIRYRLEIPPAAVLEETTITLTPVASFGNAPFMQLLGAARFAPDGLQLLTPGVLTMELTQAPPTGQIVTGFTFSDDARDLALWPANVNGLTATVPIAHFSGAGVARVEDVGFYGRNATFAEPLVGIIIRMLDVQIEHQQTGVWDVPELIDLLRQWYLEIVEPRLDGAVTSDEVFDAISSWRLWLSWLLEAGGGSVDVRGAVVEALGTEIDEAQVLAAAALAEGIASENAQCIAETNWVYAMTVAVLQQVAEEFGLAEPGTGLDAATVQAEICVQVHHVDVIFPEDPVPGEPAQLIVRSGLGYGGGTPLESGSIRTWITPVGSTDDSETSEESGEVIRQIVPTGETSLTIQLRSCIDVELPARFSVKLNRVCAEDTIVRSFATEWSYFEDFEGGTPGAEWSSTTRAISPSGERFLGEFSNESVALNLIDLPNHSEVTVEFDLYIIRSWDGNNVVNEDGPDIMMFYLGSELLKTTSFSNVFRVDDPHPQSYPGDFPHDSHPAGTGASRSNALGYPGRSTRWGDSTYRISFTRPHTLSQLDFRILATDLQEIEDESWGIDNVRVTTR